MSDGHSSALRFKPVFQKEVFRCAVDGKFLFKKFHLSGILFFKQMQDSSTRVIFQNEMGVSFFDFEWNSSDSFSVKSIMAQLNKEALIKTLRKDLELLMMKNIGHEEILSDPSHAAATVYHRFDLNNGYAYYLVQEQKLERIENAGRRKAVTSIDLKGKQTNVSMPDDIFVKHYKAGFTIQLHKISVDAAE